MSEADRYLEAKENEKRKRFKVRAVMIAVAFLVALVISFYFNLFGYIRKFLMV